MNVDETPEMQVAKNRRCFSTFRLLGRFAKKLIALWERKVHGRGKKMQCASFNLLCLQRS